MNGNVEMLNYIYQNSQMGIETIGQLAEITPDKEFKEHLHSQLEEYRYINNRAKEKLAQNGCEEKDISSLVKISAYLSIGMKTLIDRSTSHIAGMLMQGSVMGVVDVTRNIGKYSEACGGILELADRLLRFEECNINTLKKFL